MKFKPSRRAAGRLFRPIPLILGLLAPVLAAPDPPALTLFQPPPDQAAAGPDVLHMATRFQHYLEDTLLSSSPGLAVTIVARDRPSYIRTWGLRELGRHDTVDAHTTFRLASLSKAFAAATAGIYVNQGSLSWDSKLNSFLPEISLKDRQRQDAISVRHILSNSTGLMPHTYTNLVEADVPYERILSKLDAVDFVCNPGACYTYQNVVYSFIGDILQRVTGKDYPTLVREQLFTPLRMTDASVTLEDFIANSNHATPHQRRQQAIRPTSVKGSYYTVAPAAGVNASISDMEQWLQALLGARPEVLPEPLLNDLFSAQTRVNERNYYRGSWNKVKASGYGLGWRVFDYAGTQVIFHSGWVQGYHAEIAVIPSRGLGMALLMNSDYTNGVTAVPKFLDLALGLEE